MKNSYLALMYDQTPLNTLQMLFLLSHNKDAIWGQLFSCYKLKKKTTGSQRDLSVMCKCHWEHLSFLSPVSMTAVSTG